MKTAINCIIFCLILICSCKKDEELRVSNTNGVTAVNDSTTPVQTYDSIYYADIADVYIHSIYSYFQVWTCNAPIPSDTTVLCKMDLTGDANNDITFSCSTRYQMVSASNPCSNYQYVINIGFDSSATDGAVTLPSSMCDSLSYGELISSASLFRPGGSAVKVFVPNMGFSFIEGRDIYVGIKLVRNGITMYGWVLVNLSNDNGITIKSYALNRRNGNEITAGQTN